MNKNQRYYAFLALVSNRDFIDDLQALRVAQSFDEHIFPKQGFDDPEDADRFIIAQNNALQKGTLKLNEHPLWTLEKDLISLMSKYGLKSEDDKFLFETAKHYFYLNKVMLFWDRFRLTFDRKSQEVSVIIGKEATRDDIENNLSMIFSYKKKVLGKSARKSEVFQFDQHLAFYKAFLLVKKQYPEYSDYQAIKLVFERIDKEAIPSLPKNEFAGLGDQRKAYEVIRELEALLSGISLLSSREK